MSGEDVTQSHDGEQTQVDGIVERIVFSNAQNGFVIAEVKPEDAVLPVTVKGVLPGLRCGESVSVHGRKVWHKSFGLQVEADSFSVRMPASVEGLRRFLGSGLVSGVGKGFADKIVKRFGENTARVLNEESGRLKDIPGLGAKRASQIKAAWDEQRSLREVMVFLQSYGVGVRRCMRIVKEYGGDAPRLLREDPYALARDVDGIGFRTADRIALNMGIGNESPRRVQAGLVYAMGEAGEQGHTALEGDELISRAAALMGCNPNAAASGMDALLKRGDLSAYGSLVQLPVLARSEQFAADALRKILASPSSLPPILVDSAIAWAQERAGFAFAPEQADAVAAAIVEKVCVITGGPGTGKTSILRAVVDIVRAKKARILLASPTGRAAQRLASSTGMPASTLHRLLHVNPLSEGVSGEDSDLEAEMIIVDEASMIDARMAAALFRRIGPGTHLVLVGDADQLPSVGPGNVLADLISSAAVPVVRLRSVFRQSEGSEIVAAAGRILRGDATLPEPVTMAQIEAGDLPEFGMLYSRSPEETGAAVLAAGRLWKRMGVDLLDAQVLSPMRKGRAGINALNSSLADILNKPDGSCVESFSGHGFSTGEKVICTRNNYEKFVFNGDMGIVTEANAKDLFITVSFPDSTVSFSGLELADIVPAYAISIHKSQGSEFSFVSIPVVTEHLVLLRRNLLYTAITRGRNGVLLAGSEDAWRMALSDRRAGNRHTTFNNRLSGEK